jgi:WD40 repeat protein
MNFDPAKVKLAKTIATNKVGYLCAAVDVATNRLFIGATDFTIHVHDLPAITPAKLGPLKGHGSYVTAVTFLPASQTLVSGSFDKELLWWKPGETAEPRRRVKVGARVNRLAASADGKLLATGHDDLIGRVWDAATGKLVTELRDGHPLTTRINRKNTLYTIALNPDGRTLATGDRAGTVCLWETASGKRLHQMKAGDFYSQAFYRDKQNSEYEWGGVRALAFAPDGKSVIAGGMGPADQNSAGTDGPMRVESFDVATGKGLAAFVLPGTKGLIQSMFFLAGSGWLVAAGGGGQNGVGHGDLCFWQPGQSGKDGKPISPVAHKSLSIIREVLSSPDGASLIAIGSQTELAAGRIEVWDLAGEAAKK